MIFCEQGDSNLCEVLVAAISEEGLVITDIPSSEHLLLERILCTGGMYAANDIKDTEDVKSSKIGSKSNTCKRRFLKNKHYCVRS